MKTLDETVAWFQSLGVFEKCLDGRDAHRLCSFLPVADWHEVGMQVVRDGSPGERLPWTEAEILVQLKHDTAFGFEKALGKRGISAFLMHACVRLWLFILEHPLFAASADEKLYPQYGLPLFKATALAFGFENPIGADAGDEFKYSAEADR